MSNTTPINPWAAEVIKRYRQRHTIEEIREEYRKSVGIYAHKRWDDYLGETAIEEEMQLNPFLATWRKDMALPAATREMLNAFLVTTVADLVQFTVEELESLFEDSPSHIGLIMKYLEDNGIQLFHYDVFTYKVAVRMSDDEIVRCTHKRDKMMDQARQCLQNKEVPKRERLESALDILSQALLMADEEDWGSRVLYELLEYYANLVIENQAEFPDLTGDTVTVATWLLHLATLTYGDISVQVNKARHLLKAAEILSGK